MNNQEAINILGQYDVSNIHFYTTDGEEIPFTEWSDAIEMAISALQAQEVPDINVGDMISRQAAKLKVARVIWEDGDSCYDFHDKCVDCLDDVPPAQPEQPWIPVSERLPDLDRYSHGKIWERKVLITGYLSFDDKKELFVSEAFANDVINDSVHDTVVIAWMQLPKPYRAERRTE